MKPLKLPVDSLFAHRSRSGDSAAALVIALAFIVILSGLVAFFLTQSLLETQVSTASASQTEAALFARGAVDSVIGELKQEITAGSVQYYPPSGSDVRDPNCFFLPSTNQAMVPYRMDPGAPANVLKRSASNIAFYPANPLIYNTSWPAPEWAAPYSTTNVDTSGRAISTNRWNAPLLMPTYSLISTNNGPTNGFIPPDWVYMTRTAGPATTWSSTLIPNTVAGTFNTSYVVGRYAYVVYDEGGLLDVNAAGYPTSVTASAMRNKISEACADLTQIGLNSSDINALVGWRNPIWAQASFLYPIYVYTPNTNAFLTPASGERMFTSRQQLIDFLMQNVAASSSDVERMEGALPFLTHFSRELNAPSWYPPPTTVPSSGTYGYYNNATNNSATNSVGNLTNVNVFVPLARATTGTYSDSYTGMALQSTNQAVAFSRFPLSRLAWLGTNGPALGVNGLSSTPATAATQVQQSFGLVWDSSNNSTNCAWIYAGPTGSAVQSTVQSLGTITGREPNFFELLKAGILAGSVNVVPGPQFGTEPSPGTIDSRYGSTNSSSVMITVPDQQIMQIGLSTIDQASSALLPTRIEFGANTNGDWNGSLYGNKNLPYLYKMVFSPYRPTTEPADVYGYSRAIFDAWDEPVFWSPYQTVTTNTAPLYLRIRPDSTNGVPLLSPGWNMGATTAAQGVPSAGGNTYAYGIPELTAGPSGSSTGSGQTNGATFEIDNTSAASFNTAAVNPVLLYTLLTSPGFSYNINDIRATSSGGGSWTGGPPNADIYTEGTCTYAGFWLGHVWAPNPPDPEAALLEGTSSTVNWLQANFYVANKNHRSTPQFVLEANYGTPASPNWQEIQRMRFKYGVGGGSGVSQPDSFYTLQKRLNLFTFNDPRTGRFSFDVIQPPGYSSGSTTLDTVAPTYTTFPGSVAPNYFTGKIYFVPVTNFPSFTITPSWPLNQNPPEDIDTFRLADNSATGGGLTTPYYQDSDGVQRLADGWWSSATVNTLPMREDTLQDRPVFLGRPFYSVGELGYVFRDMPWRSLDFCTPLSPDAGLLDFFCVNDGYAGMTNSPVVGGVLDLNTSHPQVLQAMLNGAARAQLVPANDVSATDATNMANAITNITWNTALPLPLLNKSEIATRLAPADPTVVTNPTTQAQIDTHIKEERETIVRALASVGQVRTWNLMIDVIAQTGHLPPTATGFNNFVVTAEQRYWAHVAIDRYTGQVISIQLEPVSE